MNCDSSIARRLQFSTRWIALWTAAAVAATACCWTPAGAGEPFWRQVMPRKRVDADPNGDFTLAESNGPWLIMAAAFNGEQGESEAKALVQELRSKFNLPAYYYGMTFELNDQRPGRGLDDYGAPIKRRYQRGNQVLEHAVLVGEFPHIDDPETQHLLERVKTLEPEALKVESGEPTSQSLVAVRQLQRSIKQSLGQPVNRGPMGHAFLTRNPLLPKEYFTPTGVDPEVAKWNKDFEHSLLKCPGKYTIKVATFRGRTNLKEANDDIDDGPKLRRAQEGDALVEAVKKAHDLVVALRSKGWEAYEFHDRYESYVTIGSFDDLERLPDGRLAPSTREAQIIVNTFGAATPNDGFERATYQAIGAKEEDIQKAEKTKDEIKQEFDSRFSKSFGDAMEGFHPKQFIRIPFDIQPQPIDVPKQSLSTAYMRR